MKSGRTLRVPIHGKNGFRDINPDATEGATLGVNLFNPDGSLVTLGQFNVTPGQGIGSSYSGPTNTDGLPEGLTNFYFTDARAQAAVVIDSIADGDATRAPSRNAVFDALALKADLAGGTFTGDISVPDEAYDATAWNGSLEVPTKNAVRDKIESMSSGGTSTHTAHGRLTTESGVPVSTTDRTAQTTLYFTPYLGNQISLWDGAAWTVYTFTETSLALGTITAAQCYDVFGYVSAGALALEMLAWTNATTRATAVTLQDGRYCKSGDKTRLYLGTFYTTSTTTTEDSAGGTTASVGGKRYVWNYYNRVSRMAKVIETGNWTYNNTTTRQANADAGNQVEFVIGIEEGIVTAQVIGTASFTNAGDGNLAIGLDSTTTSSDLVASCVGPGSGNAYFPLTATFAKNTGIGRHYLAWLERGRNGVTCVFWGDGGFQIAAGLTAQLEC